MLERIDFTNICNLHFLSLCAVQQEELFLSCRCVIWSRIYHVVKDFRIFNLLKYRQIESEQS